MAIFNDKLQKFLLELGKGYLFEARQKRFTYGEDNYYVDYLPVICIFLLFRFLKLRVVNYYFSPKIF